MAAVECKKLRLVSGISVPLLNIIGSVYLVSQEDALVGAAWQAARRLFTGATGGLPEAARPLDLGFPIWEPRDLRIVSEKRIREFIERDPRSTEAIWRWTDTVESATWCNPGDLKAMFASASFVGDLTVFNIGGNKYRIAVFVHYRKQIVYIKRIGAHEEYDKWDL